MIRITVKAFHSMGTLVHDYCTEIAIIGNLYVHNNERNRGLKDMPPVSSLKCDL